MEEWVIVVVDFACLREEVRWEGVEGGEEGGVGLGAEDVDVAEEGG